MMKSEIGRPTTEAHEHGRHNRHMLWMMLVCVAVGIIGFYFGGLDYLWVALMGSCLVMHFMHTHRKKDDSQPSRQDAAPQPDND